MRRRASAAVGRMVLLGIAVTGCVESSLVPCGDQLCPSGLTCVADAICATDEQVQACATVADDGLCTTSAATGVCDRGACVAATWRATAVVGGSRGATTIGLAFPIGVAVDRAGNIYVADKDNARIRRIDAITGVITAVAGTGTAGYSGDGGVATSAQLAAPYNVAVDGLGNLYIADRDSSRIRRVDAITGIITTVAGTGTAGFAGDGGVATGAQLETPWSMAVDGLGNLYIADTGNARIRRVDAITGIITTVAGTGAAGFTGDGGPAISAQIATPTGVAVDRLGDLYIADWGNYRIRRVDALTGVITTVAGTGAAGFAGDGGPAISAQIAAPYGVALDGGGDLYISDSSNTRIRRVDAATGVITTFAGAGTPGFAGDGGPATDALLASPYGVAVDSLGNAYIADAGNRRIRRVDTTGLITTFAGNGTAGFDGGGAATSAQLRQPSSVAVDGAGAVYIADKAGARVLRVDAATGLIATFAGTGTYGFAGDGAAATTAQLALPCGVAVGALGNLYIADGGDARIRRVDATTGIITTIAGTGASGFGGDGGPATSAQLAAPCGLTVDGADNVYIADAGNQRIRRIDATTGVIATIAGTGTSGFAGDGAAATGAQLASPPSVAVDGAGNVYIADTDNRRVRRVDATTGVITTLAGTGTAGFTGDGGPATGAQLTTPLGVAADSAGDVYIADAYRLRRVDATTGVITTVAGTGTFGFSGDGGAATSARFKDLAGVTVDGRGDVYIADAGNTRVRRIDATTGVITTVAGMVAPEGMGPLARAQLADPRALIVAPELTLIAGGASGTVQAIRATEVEAVAGRYPQSVATGALARFRDQSFGTVAGVALDAAAGRMFLTEATANRLHVVSIVDPDREDTWTIAPLANADGAPGFADGAAAAARFRAPAGLYLDAATDTLYVADAGNHAIRAIDLSAGVANATVRTVAGTPRMRGFFGDGGPAAAALLYEPQALARCPNGDLFIADTRNHRVRRIAADTQIITTVLGVGVAASSGDGGPAATFPVDTPLGLACDAGGNLLVSSTTVVRLLPADRAGVVDGTGLVETIYGAAPRDFPASVTRCLTGLEITGVTTALVADSCAGMLVELRLVHES